MLTDTQKASIEAFCDKEFSDEHTFYDYLFAKYLEAASRNDLPLSDSTAEDLLNAILEDAKEKGY